MAESLKQLINTIAHPGTLVWMGLRPQRRAPVQIVERAEVTFDGLVGDHASKGRQTSGKRGITLIQQEHLAVIGSFLRQRSVDPALLRRNLVIEGINLLALKGRTIRISTATLTITGPCAPCSRMEEAFGKGGYSAVRGHGGVTAQIVEPGTIARGDEVCPVRDNTM
jgi:MOSC domain-containing protein YiiM